MALLRAGDVVILSGKMLTFEAARALALSFKDAAEQPHFELTSFRVKNRIFLTLDAKRNRACLMLTPADQSVFTAYDSKVLYPVPNAWGRRGATFVELNAVRRDMFRDALQCAYHAKASRRSAKTPRGKK